MGLTKRQLEQQTLFATEYVKDFNGTRAAQRAGYKGDESSLAATASRLLRYVNVREKLTDLLSANAMEAEEALWRLAGQARADVSMFIKTKGDSYSLDWVNVKKYGYLIKSITQTKYGPKIVLHDSQKALELIGKHFAIFTDRVKIDWQDKLPDGTNETEVIKQFQEALNATREKSEVGSDE